MLKKFRRKLKKTALIIEARTQSSRYPNKIFKKIGDLTVIDFLLNRLSSIKIQKIVATTKNPKDKKIINLCKKKGINFFAGSEDDLIKRVLDCAKKYNIEYIVSLTSDNPLVERHYILKYLNLFFKKNLDYLDNIQSKTFPRGFAIRIVKASKLKETSKYVRNSKKYNFRQHTCKFFMDEKNHNRFKGFFVNSRKYIKYRELRITIDYKEDLKLVNTILMKNNFDINISLNQITKTWDRIK
tara:strand:- start:185 stop:907 length:723 start_codon:yes stop_codon:yes gene_type:complete